MTARRGHDVLVIGGGVIGTAVLFFLACEGVDAALVDRGDVATGTSGATMGNLSLHNRMPGPTWDLAMESRGIYADWASTLGTDFEFEITSSLMLVDTEDRMEWVKRRAEVQRAAGLDVEVVPSRQLRELDRTVSSDVAGAVYCGASARLNPFLLCRALARHAERLGATMYRHTEVTGVDVQGQTVRGVQTPSGPITCGAVVDAAGAEADRVGQMASVPIHIVRDHGCIVVSERLPYLGIRIKGECTEGGGGEDHRDELARRNNIHMVFSQTSSGNCLVGRSGVRCDRLSGSSTLEAAVGILRRAGRFIPALSGLSAIRVFHGVRPYSQDGLPLLGEVGEPQGFYAACGFGDRGFALGAAGARLVARSIMGSPGEISQALSAERIRVQLRAGAAPAAAAVEARGQKEKEM